MKRLRILLLLLVAWPLLLLAKDAVTPGQVVVTAGVHVLNPGQKVKFYVDPGAASGASVAASASSAATAVSVK